jgi:hypothetical protein
MSMWLASTLLSARRAAFTSRCCLVASTVSPTSLAAGLASRLTSLAASLTTSPVFSAPSLIFSPAFSASSRALSTASPLLGLGEAYVSAEPLPWFAREVPVHASRAADAPAMARAAAIE